METADPSDDLRVGRHVRRLRRARGLTMTQLAALADLSQPFLSQLERGLAQPSMASLSRIAHALGSSQLEIMAGAADLTRGQPGPAPAVVRADEGDRGPYGFGEARLLVSGDRPFYPMTFVADNADPGEFHRHVEDEFLHVLSGCCHVDLDGDGCHVLAEGDSLYYVGGTPHRWFSPTGTTYRLFVVKQHVPVPGPEGGSAPRLLVAPQEA
jgi:transcriptional regulator with XRE-family HTH domain